MNGTLSVRTPLQLCQLTSKFLSYKNVLIFLGKEEFNIFKWNPTLGPNSHNRSSLLVYVEFRLETEGTVKGVWVLLFQQNGGMLFPCFFIMLHYEHSLCHKTGILVNDKDKLKKTKQTKNPTTVLSTLSKKQLVIFSAALITLNPSVRAGLCSSPQRLGLKLL